MSETLRPQVDSEVREKLTLAEKARMRTEGENSDRKVTKVVVGSAPRDIDPRKPSDVKTEFGGDGQGRFAEFDEKSGK